MQLEDYGLSPERGFLSPFELDEVALPAMLAPAEEAAKSLSRLLVSGRVRHWLDRIEDPRIEDWTREAPDAEVRAAMVRYGFLVQAYVWGEHEPATALPANLSRPIVAIARRLGQAPLLPYSAYVLDNWARLDKAGPIALDNIRMVQNFLGGEDEDWFVMVHVAIEAEAAPIAAAAAALVDAARERDADLCEAMLTTMNAAWENIYAAFRRMPERCDPYIYFHRVRPFIHGWANNPALPGGLVYEGIERFGGKPQPFRGQTGSQSSIVPMMDAVLGVTHSADPLKRFLDDLHHYRPVQHRRFIEDLAARSTLRAFVTEHGGSTLKEAFNANLEQVARFRTRHLEYAANYINKQASAEAGNDPDVGTGGTPFMKYLKKHRDENAAQVV